MSATAEQVADLTADEFRAMWDAPHCESPHEAPDNRVCTHTPVAVAASCRGRWKVCRATVNRNRHHVAAGVRCRGCKRPASDCWMIAPL